VNGQLLGFGFPFRIAAGGVARAAGADKVDQNVRHLLGTGLGERPMLRTYGGGVHHRLQDPADGTLRALVKHDIEGALRSYAPDVQLTGPISVSVVEEQLTVVIQYLANPQDVLRRIELQMP
jgi:phage baseplate assembly protein W